ncbi:hypothetical protein COCNU_14G007150 [Cocos nucifera]|uniref:Uncharacterized protein n=1 Tax=Cocos nucifera TaxID=13894 RepID=A0A8K0NCH9_COCNU|nr:hypothetical protein COCNU_14G007150 [Cocos nucifera]
MSNGRQALNVKWQAPLMSLTLIEHYLVSFAGITRASALELAEVKEEIDKLRYHLEQEKATNAELTKEVDCSEEALWETPEMIDRRDDEMRRAYRRIEDLERWRSKVE